MEIVRLPKAATVARLVLSKGSLGRLRGVFSVQGPMTGYCEEGEYETAEQAEQEAVAGAERRHANILIVEDRS